MSKKLFRCSILIVCVFLALGAAESNAAAQTPNAQDDFSDNRPWDELPDGRVVIEIKGNKIAFDREIGRDEKYVSLQFSSPTPSRFKEMSFQDVLEYPGIARTVFKSWEVVRISTQNSRSSPGLFLGRYDRKTIPVSPRIDLKIFSDPQAMLCQPNTDEIDLHGDCARFTDLARGFKFRRNLDLIVARHPKSKSSETEPDIDGWTTYIFPMRERKTATFEAVYFQCENVADRCRNDSRDFVGYAIRKNVSLYFEFSRGEYPMERMRALDRKMQEVFDDVLLNRE